MLYAICFLLGVVCATIWGYFKRKNVDGFVQDMDQTAKTLRAYNDRVALDRMVRTINGASDPRFPHIEELTMILSSVRDLSDQRKIMVVRPLNDTTAIEAIVHILEESNDWGGEELDEIANILDSVREVKWEQNCTSGGFTDHR